MRLRDGNDNPDLDAAPLPDVRDRAWYRFVEQIRLMRDCPEYRWADGQLARIQARVERSQQVTEGQRLAIEKIRESEWAPGRAYDAAGAGYGRRWR